MQRNDTPQEFAMSYTGYVKIWRQLFLNDLLKQEPYCRGYAWIDLISMADFEGPDIGRVKVSLRGLAARWKWSLSRVRSFLSALEKAGMITTQLTTQVATQITICNYSDFQAEPHRSRHTSRHILEERRKKEDSELSKDSSCRKLPLSDLSASEAFHAYNCMAAKISLPKAWKLTTARKRAIQTRLREYGSEAWMKALGAIEASAFLRGQNDRGWTASLDFMIQPSSFAKLVEGQYGNGAAHAQIESWADRVKRGLLEEHEEDQP